jgi:hypothetical protein
MLLLAGQTAVYSQEPPPDLIRITGIDDSEYPLIKVNLLTINAQGGPVDVGAASLRENGIPVAFALAEAPLGVDAVFVIDANETLAVDDAGDGVTRAGKAAAAIGRYAAEFMRPGLDSVTVIVPDAANENGRFLLKNETDPQAVQEALAGYAPEGSWPTPLQAMLAQAIDHTAGADGRYHPILLFTDAGRIHLQLAYDDLITAAQTAETPIFSAILGVRADAEEQFRVNRLAEPTRGAVIHMPQPDAADALFEVWAQQGSQPQLQYQSLQTSSGSYPVTVHLGLLRAAAELDLTLLPPEVTIQPQSLDIVRQGAAHDTPLAELEPAQQPIPVQISWPDGKPRPLTAVSWEVDGQRQPPPENLTPDAAGQILLNWNVANLEAGRYEMVVEAFDELGLAGESGPAIFRIRTERPEPPTPTPQPSPTPTPEITAVLPDAAQAEWLPLLAVGVAALLILLLLRRRRRKTEPEPAAEPDDLPQALPLPEERPSAEAPLYTAWLEPLGSIPPEPVQLAQGNVILGRDESVAQIVLDDKSVARLHARIAWQNGRYWLYDEGSAQGTYLNYTRLGLSPQAMSDGDVVGVGGVQFRFTLRLKNDA